MAKVEHMIRDLSLRGEENARERRAHFERMEVWQQQRDQIMQRLSQHQQAEQIRRMAAHDRRLASHQRMERLRRSMAALPPPSAIHIPRYDDDDDVEMKSDSDPDRTPVVNPASDSEATDSDDETIARRHHRQMTSYTIPEPPPPPPPAHDSEATDSDEESQNIIRHQKTHGSSIDMPIVISDDDDDDMSIAPKKTRRKATKWSHVKQHTRPQQPRAAAPPRRPKSTASSSSSSSSSTVVKTEEAPQVDLFTVQREWMNEHMTDHPELRVLYATSLWSDRQPRSGVPAVDRAFAEIPPIQTDLELYRHTLIPKKKYIAATTNESRAMAIAMDHSDNIPPLVVIRIKAGTRIIPTSTPTDVFVPDDLYLVYQDKYKMIYTNA